MHILFTRFPLESALGGAEIQTLSLMEGLIERGHTIEFAGSCPILLAECKKRNIRTTELHIGNPPVTKTNAISFLWRKAKMRRKLKILIGERRTENGEPDAIVMLSLSEKLLLTDIAVDAGIKVFWIEHDRVGNWLTKNPWLALLRKQSTKAMTIVVSELSRKTYLAMGWDNDKVIAIGNGIASPPNPLGSCPELVEGSHPTYFPGEGELLHLGCIARLSYEKGVDVLIKAMADLPKNITLEIIGTGREERSLKELSRTLQLNDRITFTPYTEDVYRAYARWDALVLPSRDHDPFGMVAAEAMFSGLPVIVTNQCGIADYLEDGKDSMIVEADSSTALAAGIMSVQKAAVRGPEALRPEWEDRKQLADHGKTTAMKKFSVNTMVKRYEDVFTGNQHS